MLSHREWFFRLSYLSLSFLINPISAADGASKNADSLVHESGGKWTDQLPISTEASIPGNMPKGPEITPQYDQPSDSKSGGSSGWGILGFFINLGKKSAKDQHAEDVQRNIDRALSKSASGIPLTSEDYAALGTADLSKVRAYPREAQQDAARAAIAKHFDAKAAAEKAATAAKAAAATATPTPTTTTPLTTTPLPTNANTSHSSNFIAPHIGKGSKTCLLQMTEYGVPGVVQTATTIPISSTPKLPSMPSGDKPNFPSVGSGNPPTIGGVMIPPAPMKGPNGPSGGNMATGLGGAIASAGTLAQVATAGGAATTAGGGTVITAAAACTVLTTVAIGAAVVSGLAFGTVAVLDYNYPTERNVFFKGRYQEKLRREANAKKNDGNQQNPKGPSNSGPAAIAAQNTENARKVNTLQRTEAMNKLKENYRYDNQTKLYKLKDNGAPIKCTRTGKDVINVKWDPAHGDIEALNKNLKHMGSLDPVTFEMYKGPEITRREL